MISWARNKGPAAVRSLVVGRLANQQVPLAALRACSLVGPVVPSPVMRLLVCVMLLGCETVQVRPPLELEPEPVVAEVREEVDETPALTALSLGVGPRSSCAVLADHSLWCWGDGEDALLGGDPGPGPVRVLESAGLSRVVVGQARVCFLADEGLRCFGNINPRHDYRYGRNPVSATPAAVPGLEDVSDFALGNGQACFVDSEGGVRCTGHGPQAGENARVDRAGPTIVTGADGIATGLLHSCALVQGGVQCWGQAPGGRLGGTSVRYFSDSAHPVPDLAGVRGVSIYSRGSQTCALLADDEIRCWGQTNTTNRQSRYALLSETPMPLEAIGEPIAKVVAGLVQVFAIAESGAVYRYVSREPVHEDTVSGSSRLRVSYGSPVRLDLPPVADIGVGLSHTCALTRDGVVLCWGLGAGGRLGNGTNESLSTPTRVPFVGGSET